MQNRGLSDVVGTVLFIVLTIAVVGIVWIGVIPLIRNNIVSADMCAGADISVDSSQGYTCWDKNQNIILVQVKMGSIDVNVSGFKFFVSSGGNSVYFPDQSRALPNSYNVFYLNSSGILDIDQIGVSAVVQNGLVLKDCPAIFINRISNCNAGVVDSSKILNSSIQK